MTCRQDTLTPPGGCLADSRPDLLDPQKNCCPEVSDHPPRPECAEEPTVFVREIFQKCYCVAGGPADRNLSCKVAQKYLLTLRLNYDKYGKH